MKRLQEITHLLLVGFVFILLSANISAETPKLKFIESVTKEKSISTTGLDFSGLDLQLPVPLKKKHQLFTIHGSNTVGAALAPSLAEGFLKALGATNVRTINSATENEQSVVGRYQYGNQSTTLKVSIAAHGSSTGFKGLLNKKADIAASSRPIKSKEKIQLSAKEGAYSGPKEIVLGIDGLAIIVHPNNPIANLSLSQLEKIYTGKIKNWKDVGGISSPIHVLARDSKSGTYDTFKNLVIRKKKLAPNADRYESNDELSLAVTRDQHAIGFVALASINNAKALAISDAKSSGILPSELSVATEDYPLSRRLYFYRAITPHRSAVVDAFLTYAESDKGQQLVQHTGFVSQQLYALPNTDVQGDKWSRLNLNIRFQKDTSNLDTKAKADVQRLVSFLEQNKQTFSQVRFVGYSNPSKDKKDRSPLSKLRAQNVRWALRNEGVRNKVKTVAGSSTFVADPNSIRKDKNRRVEVWVQ